MSALCDTKYFSSNTEMKSSSPAIATADFRIKSSSFWNSQMITAPNSGRKMRTVRMGKPLCSAAAISFKIMIRLPPRGTRR